jgi:hypothetical protein
LLCVIPLMFLLPADSVLLLVVQAFFTHFLAFLSYI